MSAPPEPHVVATLEPPPGLRDRVARAIATEPPPPSLRVSVRIALAIVGTLVPCAALVVLSTRRDLAALPPAQLLASTSILLLSSAIAMGVAIAPGRLGVGPSLASLTACAVLTPVVYLAATSTAPLHPVVAAVRQVPLAVALRGATTCFVIGAALSAMGLVGLFLALRRAVPVAASARGAVVGAAVGSLAGLALHLHCPSFDRVHLVAGHVLPMLVFVALGAWAAPRLLRP